MQIPQQALDAVNSAPLTRTEGSLTISKVVGTPSQSPATPVTPKPAASSLTSQPLIGEKLTSLMNSIDPSFKLTPEAEEILLQLADDFIDKVVDQSSMIASHRAAIASGDTEPSSTVMGSNSTIDVADVSLVLREKWGISVPGLSAPGSNAVGGTNAEIAKMFAKGGLWSTGTEKAKSGGKGKGGGGGGGKK
jgi:transcription initiation factor TFIID subunit 12